MRSQNFNANITHIFREGNNVADLLANEVVKTQQRKEYKNFADLPSNITSQINIDKSQIPTFIIRTRRSNIQQLTYQKHILTGKERILLLQILTMQSLC